MIIDLILDRKGGVKYSANGFYIELMQYRQTWPAICDPIITAMDAGEEQDVISELCNYVKEQQWPESFCNYISAVKWLEDDPEDGFEIRVKYQATNVMGKDYVERFITWQPIPPQRDTHEKIMKPLTDTLRIALNMGWQVWRRLTMEVPEIHQTLVCEPKDAKAAEHLRNLLEQAERDGKPVTTETQARTIIMKSIH